MTNKIFYDLIATAVCALSLYQIYKYEQISILDYWHISPYLILLIALLICTFFYFTFLRKKTLFESLILLRNIRHNYPWLALLLTLLITGSLVFSLRYEKYFEYIQFGKMQVLTPFIKDRWNGSIYWIAPPSSPNYQEDINKKNWEKFPLDNFAKDIYGVWHLRPNF